VFPAPQYDEGTQELIRRGALIVEEFTPQQAADLVREALRLEGYSV
jgi:hypothetical protein